MLDIIADYLDMRGLSFGRLDGTMKFTDRQEQVRVWEVCVWTYRDLAFRTHLENIIIMFVVAIKRKLEYYVPKL